MFHWSEVYPEDCLPVPVSPETLSLLHGYELGLMPAGVWLKFEVDTRFHSNMKAYFRKVRDEMAKKRQTTATTTANTPPTLGYDAPTRWLNVYLTDDDASFLSELDVTLDTLAAQLVALGVEGWDVSLKRREQDASCMASIVSRDPYLETGRVGLSAWSDNFPDAIAALLYKFHDKLGGVIPPPYSDPIAPFSLMCLVHSFTLSR